MKILILIIYVLTPFVAVSNGNQLYDITRKAAGSTDIFQVSSITCSGLECDSFNKDASFDGTCKCSCPPGAATFGFHKGNWSCRNNTEFREQTGLLKKLILVSFLVMVYAI